MSTTQNASSTGLPGESPVPLEAILCTEELARRPPRPAHHDAEARALNELAQALADSPRTILQKLAEVLLELTDSGSAGVSLIHETSGDFWWPALAGAWKPHLGGGTPRHFGPCCDVLDQSEVLLFRQPQLRYTYLAAACAPIAEALLAPFYVQGKAIGTVWVVAHDDMRKFDAEDKRQLTSIAGFASAAYQTWTAIHAAESQNEMLRRREQELSDFFDNATVGLHWVGPDGIILRANRAELSLLGYTQEEYVGRHISEFHVDRTTIESVLARLTRGEEIRGQEARLRCKDGSIKTVLLDSNVLFEKGRFIHTRCFTSDITERKRSERMIVEQKELLELELRDSVLLQRLSAEIMDQDNVEALYDSLMDAVSTIMRSDFASMQMLHPERGAPGSGGELRLLAFRGFDAETARFWEWVRADSSSTCGVALRTGVRSIVADVMSCDWMAATQNQAAYLKAGILAAQSTPLVSRAGALVGMISTHWKNPHQPTERDLRLLDILARQAADLIEHKQAGQALRNADRRKDEFLATLAHELRNPLAPIRNAVEFLRLKGSADPELQTASAIIERQVRQMSRLVDDLLEVSRITLGKINLQRERVSLMAVVTDVMESSRPLIEASDHELTITLPVQPISVDGDPIRLAQIFSNLLANAVKYMEKGGHIWLTVERRSGEAVVSVRDAGIGIDPEHLPRVFEKFSQAAPALHRAQGGLGIGLSLVRALVELHGGSVQASSGGIGMGSEFIVRLPVADAPSRQPQEPRDNGQLRAKATCRILVVDDNRDAAQSTDMLLRAMGHETRTAHDGLEAVQAAETFRPDVVLLDIGLPGVDGYEVARRIRQHAWGTNMRLIALTGWGQDADKRRSTDAGFDHHLTKPVARADLQNLLNPLPRPGNATVEGHKPTRSNECDSAAGGGREGD